MRVTLLVAVLAAACMDAASGSLFSYDWEFHRVSSFDGTELAVNTFEPKGLASDAAVPIVIFINSWATPSIEYVAQCQAAAKRGYFAVEYGARGWYTSGGQVGPASADDMADHTAILDWVALTWGGKVDKTNVATAGISYGAGISLIAAALNPNIKAVVALSGWASLLDALYWNQAPSDFWATLLAESVKIVGNPQDDLFYHLDNINNYRNIDESKAWAAGRSPRSYLAQLNARGVPIFLGNNFEDHLFHANFQIDFWQQLQGPKKLYLGQGIHIQAEATGLIPLVPNDVWVDGQKWIDRFLRAEQNGIDEAPLVRVEVSAKKAFSIVGESPNFEHVFYSSWPPVKPSEAYTVLRYGLKPRGWTSGNFGQLVSAGSAPSSAEVLAFTKKTVMNTGIPAVTPLLKPLLLHEVNLKKIKSDHEVVFISEPFAQTTRVCGNVVLEGLQARSLTHERFQVMSTLWRVEPSSWLTFWTREATLLAHGPLAVWESTAGEDVPLSDISFHALCSDIAAGESVALGINLYNVLYAGPTHDTSLRVELKYTPDTVLSVPTVALVEDL